MSPESLVIREMQPRGCRQEARKDNCGEDEERTQGTRTRGYQQVQALWKTIRSFLTKVIHVSDNPETPFYTSDMGTSSNATAA